MLHRLYMRTLALAASPRALWWLAAVAFAESSFFPIPPDALLIPMILARPDRAWRFAAICMVGSVVGGALGYAIGYFVFDQVMRLPLAHALFGPRPIGIISGLVCAVGSCGDPDQGADADSIQAGHHRLRCREVQLPRVHGRQHRDPGRHDSFWSPPCCVSLAHRCVTLSSSD